MRGEQVQGPKRRLEEQQLFDDEDEVEGLLAPEDVSMETEGHKLLIKRMRSEEDMLTSPEGLDNMAMPRMFMPDQPDCACAVHEAERDSLCEELEDGDDIDGRQLLVRRMCEEHSRAPSPDLQKATGMAILTRQKPVTALGDFSDHRINSGSSNGSRSSTSSNSRSSSRSNNNNKKNS